MLMFEIKEWKECLVTKKRFPEKNITLLSLLHFLLKIQKLNLKGQRHILKLLYNYLAVYIDGNVSALSLYQ